jgi:uncharacterized spore protein YtfJ
MDPQAIITGAQDALTVRRVFGDPIQTDSITIIPVASIAGGGGGGRGEGAERGAGFGIKARPAGVYVIRDGDARWRPAVDVNRIVLGGQLVAITALITLRPILTRWLGSRSAAG